MAVEAVLVQIMVPGEEAVPYRTFGRHGGLPPYLPAKGDTVVWDGRRYQVREIEHVFHEGGLVVILVHVAEPEPPTNGGIATDLATRRKSA